LIQRVRFVDGEEAEIPEFIVDVTGHLIDLRNSVWNLHSATSTRTSMNWKRLDGCEQDSVRSLKVHAIRLIERTSVSNSVSAFRQVGDFLIELRNREQSLAFASMMSHLERLRSKKSGYLFHYVRQWYTASADRMLDGFDDEVAFALDDLRIEGNAKGFAVLSADPECGPLSEFEETALRQALFRDCGPIDARAALWLAFAFGTNPANMGLLREEDFTAIHFPDETPSAFFLNVPRIKKRQPARIEFKKRFVDNPLARIIEELIAHNKAVAPTDPVRPLFRLERPRKALMNGPLAEYAFHHSGESMNGLIKDCVARLNVISPRTAKPLAVTTRRLRYTFASKMVRMGTSERELAELLDHTDTQQVMVYYKADSRFVERLDATIAKHIGPTIRAFMGSLADRDSKQVDLIPFRDLPALGQCGASFICGLSPPKNCYNCAKFKAFKDGPHATVLDSLVAERDDLIAGGNERLAQQLDATILAVGEIVAKIDEDMA